MKILKKILAVIFIVVLLSLFGAYFYFDQKFTPEKNYLTVKNESGKIPITWLGTDKNVMLVPIQFSGDVVTYYMQFDTGSPYTIFYAESIKDLKAVKITNKIAKTSFHVGKTEITSSQFKIINHGKGSGSGIEIIGTLGADVLENRKTLINLKENCIVFNVSNEPIAFKNKLFAFKFKKRKIIIEGVFKGKAEQFLYDSGTSAYELLTTKEVWAGLKISNSKVVVEKTRSWQNILTAYTANCNDFIRLGNLELPLREVTYVEGFSQSQYLLMKYAGMTGMLGNKIFLNHCIYLDCSENKIGIQ